MERWVSLSGLDASDPRRRAALGGDGGGITQGQVSEGAGPQVSSTKHVLYPAVNKEFRGSRPCVDQSANCVPQGFACWVLDSCISQDYDVVYGTSVLFRWFAHPGYFLQPKVLLNRCVCVCVCVGTGTIDDCCGARLSSLLEGCIVFFPVFWFLAVVVMVKMFSAEHTPHALVNDRCVVRYSTHG